MPSPSIRTALADVDVLRQTMDTDGTTRLGSRLRVGEKVDEAQLRALGERIGFAFPEDYVRLVCDVGLLYVESSWNGEVHQLDGQMLDPAQIEEIHSAFSVWVASCSSEYDDDPEGAALEQAVRDALVPFQFIGDGTAWDVYCFDRRAPRAHRYRVLPAWHDDDEMLAWDEQDDDERVYGIGEHLVDWLSGRGDPASTTG